MGLGELTSTVKQVHGQSSVIISNHTEIALLNGHLFSVSYTWLGVADDATVSMLFTEDDTGVFHSGEFNVGGNALQKIYETPAYSDAGTELALINRNRLFPDISNPGIFIDPTITDNGQLIDNQVIPGGKGNFVVGGESGLGTGWIGGGKQAVINITNVSGKAIDISILTYVIISE